jgi:tRNA modification GTPase
MAHTVFALATPPQPAPAALMRISGPQSPKVAKALFKADWRRANIRTKIELPVGQTPCIAWLMPAPETLTGEDTLELILPGHAEILRDLEERLREQGCRDAEPGEFTRRALDAGKIELSQAEATLALVTASDDAARRQAMADLRGDSARALARLTERLRELSARFEMSFDFSEEEHAHADEERLAADLRALTQELQDFSGTEGPRPGRELPRIALFGPPNAGKSSLFNALIGERRALVNDLPGTTRDPVQHGLTLGSQHATLEDLSGVGSLDGDQGRFATRAREHAAGADVLLVLCAPAQQSECLREFETLTARDPSVRARALWVHTMADLCSALPLNPAGLPEVTVSAASGAGLDDLRAQLAQRLGELAAGGVTSLLRSKSREALTTLQGAIADPHTPPEAMAGEVRRALRLLDHAMLSSTPGEILDLIFSRFCIGK